MTGGPERPGAAHGPARRGPLPRAAAAAARWSRRRWKWLAVPVAIVVVVLVAADRLLDEPLRRQMERRLNASLKGYAVTLGGLDFHLVGGAIDLEDLIVRQERNPEPPVARIPRLTASIQWRVLLHGRVVADVEIERPTVHVSRPQLVSEADDPVPVEQRGWQEAVAAIYPFKINLLRVREGTLTYAEEAGRPLELRHIAVRAENIRNIIRRDHAYPSTVHLEADVFEAGRLVLDGGANLLAEPHPGIRASMTLERLALDYLKPVAARYNVVVEQGSVSARGELEYAPWLKKVHLHDVTLDDLRVDFVHTAPTASREAAVRQKVAQAAGGAANAPGLLLRVDRAHAARATVGYVNRAASPAYRVFLSGADLSLENVSNHFAEGTAVAVLEGRFMGSGATAARATFRPETSGPDFDVDVRIDNTDMRTMNRLLRAYGKFDVNAGWFSFYTQLRIKNGQISGYVKPLFRDMDVYDERQDRDKSVVRKLYEGLIGGLAKLLENTPRDEVATKTSVRGRVDDPKTSTLEILVRLVQNAFFQAILPGFDRELARLRRG